MSCFSDTDKRFKASCLAILAVHCWVLFPRVVYSSLAQSPLRSENRTYSIALHPNDQRKKSSEEIAWAIKLFADELSFTSLTLPGDNKDIFLFAFQRGLLGKDPLLLNHLANLLYLAPISIPEIKKTELDSRIELRVLVTYYLYLKTAAAHSSEIANLLREELANAIFLFAKSVENSALSPKMRMAYFDAVAEALKKRISMDKRNRHPSFQQTSSSTALLRTMKLKTALMREDLKADADSGAAFGLVGLAPWLSYPIAYGLFEAYSHSSFPMSETLNGWTALLSLSVAFGGAYGGLSAGLLWLARRSISTELPRSSLCRKFVRKVDWCEASFEN